VEAAFAMLEAEEEEEEVVAGAQTSPSKGTSQKKRTLQRSLSGKGTQMFNNALAKNELDLDLDLDGIFEGQSSQEQHQHQQLKLQHQRQQTCQQAHLQLIPPPPS
jgi:hypothetical protein